jgi:transcription-repair coupling factor (superfamily II helicase)
VHLRLTMYKRIASAATNEQLEELQVETIDRFGLLPDAAKNLFEIAELKLRAAKHDIKVLEVGPSGGVIKFVKNPDINIDQLMRAIATNPREYRFTGAESIQVSRQMPDAEQRFALVKDVFELISNK